MSAIIFLNFRTGTIQILGAAAAILLVMTIAAHAENDTVIATARLVANHLAAAAEVEPISLLRFAAPLSGSVAGIDVVPGSTVAAGEVLARVQGPAVESLVAARQSEMASNEADLTASRQSLAIQRRKLAMHLGTEEMVDHTRAAVAGARARLAAAKSALAALQEETTLRCPEQGQVLSISVANGEFVTPGQSLLTVQPANRLWLTASFYGADMASIRPGMKGRFDSDGGGPAIPVTVQGVIGGMQPDGGLRVTLSAASAGWRSGEFGTVTLIGKTETLVAVPTRALILDQGRWWVMVRTSHGDKRQAVTPGPAQGDLTLIRQGIDPGAKVVAENAYLDFHRNVANSFQKSD